MTGIRGDHQLHVLRPLRACHPQARPGEGQAVGQMSNDRPASANPSPPNLGRRDT
jgi:hypothetical protein